MSRPITIEFSLNESEFLQNYEIEVKNNPQFDFLIINNASSTKSGLELISQPWFKSKLSCLTNLFAIKLKINEKIDDLLLIDDCGTENLVLIAFQSTVDKFESKTYWKVAGREKFHSLHVDEDLSQELSSLCHVYLMKLLKDKDSGVLGELKDQTEVRLDEICSIEKENLLMHAALNNQPIVVQELLNREFDVNFANCEREVAIDYAWTKYTNSNDENDKNTASNIILQLLKMNSELPIYFDYSEASKEVQEFVDMCESLHRDLDDRNFDSLNEKLDQNPSMTFFYDRNKSSLLLHALSMQNSSEELILSLIKRGLNFGPFEELLEDEAVKLKSLHQKSSKECPEVHILKLRSRTQIGNNHELKQQYWNLVDDAYKILDSNELCSKMLKVAAESKLVKFYFDFKHDTVYYLDPTKANRAKARAYRNGTIYVGAKYLKDEKRKFLVLSYLAHELCHVVMLLTFFNPNFDPFPMGRSDVKTRYLDEVLDESKIKKDSEDIVKNVFGYDENEQTSELVVTVPQMMMHYLHDEVKLLQLRQVFKELFGYVDGIVEPELERAVDVLKWLNDEKRNIKFENLTEPMKARISHKEINLQGQETTFFNLTGNDQEASKLLSSNQIRRILVKNENLDFGEICELKIDYELVDRRFIESEMAKSKPKYIRYRFFENYERNPIKDFEAVKNEVKSSKIFILADHAGSGKTTTFMDYAMKLKAAEKDSWVSYVKLRKFREVFEKYNHKIGSLTNQELLQILSEIAGLKPEAKDEKSKIELKIFEKLSLAGKVILLLDGVDEVCPKYEQLMMEIFKVWKESGSENQLWISTRPHYAKKLKETFGVSVHEFAFYTKDEKIQLIINILESKKISDKPTQSQMIEGINNCLSHLELNSISKEEIDNPLMITMITKLFIQDPSRHDMNNRYELYSAMIEMQKNKLSDKISGEDRDPNSRLNIWHVHQLLALKDIIDGNPAYQEVMESKIDGFLIAKMWKNEKKNWTSHKIQRYGLVNVEFSSDPKDDGIFIDFMHKTISEFFIAQFIIESMFDDNYLDRDEEIERKFKLLDFVISAGFSGLGVIADFISCYIRNQAQSENKVYHEIVKRKIMKTIEDIHNGICSCEVNTMYEKVNHFHGFASIVTIDNEIKRKLWKVDETDNIIKIVILKECISYDEKFTRLANIHFGVNWHEEFNKSDQQLIKDEDFHQFKANLYDVMDLRWEDDKNLLKLCDLVDKNFDTKEIEKFYTKLRLDSVNSEKILIEILSRMRKSLDIETLSRKILNEPMYKFSNSEVLDKICNEILYDLKQDG